MEMHITIATAWLYRGITRYYSRRYMCMCVGLNIPYKLQPMAVYMNIYIVC